MNKSIGKVMAVCVVLSVGGCARYGIADASDSMVAVHANLIASRVDIDAEARRGCALYDKVAVFLSTSPLPFNNFRYLFACAEADEAEMAKKRLGLAKPSAP